MQHESVNVGEQMDPKIEMQTEVDNLPQECKDLLDARDGDVRLLERLPKIYSPKTVATGGMRPFITRCSNTKLPRITGLIKEYRWSG
jgi:hypothetical protein